MRIEENKVFLFNFESAEMGGGCSFPIRANSREEAVAILQKCLGRFNMELSMEFPRIAAGSTLAADMLSSGQVVPVPDSASGTEVPMIPSSLDGVLIERISKLMNDLGGGELQGEALADTIKNWTELDYVPANYAKIVPELEKILGGQKEVKPKGKSK